MRSVLATVLAVLSVVLVPLHAAPISFFAYLDGPSEDPPNASPGTGFVLVTIDRVAHTLFVEANFTGLTGLTTASHIHIINGPGDGNVADTNGPVATQTPSFIGFPLGVTSGSFSETYGTTDAASFRAGFITSAGGTTALAEDALFDGIEEGRAYFNIHSTTFGGGEIRGFLQPVPEPGTVALFGLGLISIALVRRRRH